MKPIEMIKEDWETTKKRYTHWWAHDLYDRALILATAPKRGVQRGEWPGGTLTPEIAWTNVDYMIWRIQEEIRTTFYAGEALPLFYHNCGGVSHGRDAQFQAISSQIGLSPA